jgi:hypothetical protein
MVDYTDDGASNFEVIYYRPQVAQKEYSKMLDVEDLKVLIDLRSENRNLDYKETILWDSDHKDEKRKIIKDILAMANTQDGGVIICGIRDEDYELVGVSDQCFEGIDTTKINDLLHNYSEPEFSCNLYKIKINNKKIIVIEVPEFTEEPIICKKDAHSSVDNNRLILKEAQIYIRTDKATSEPITSVALMRKLLGMALRKKRELLLTEIKNILEGRIIEKPQNNMELYKKCYEETVLFLNENIEGKLNNVGYWEIIAYPLKYIKSRFQDLGAIDEAVKNASVNLRGWDFPHIDNTNAFNFNSGRQSFTIYKHFIEGFRAYENGFFCSRKVFWEDAIGKSEAGKSVKSFNSLIYEVTEFILFLKRFFEVFLIDEDIYVNISMYGVKDRILVSYEPGIHFYETFIAKDDPIVCENIWSLTELLASYNNLAIKIIQRIYLLFNMTKSSEEMIKSWQTKFLERKLR